MRLAIKIYDSVGPKRKSDVDGSTIQVLYPDSKSASADESGVLHISEDNHFLFSDRNQAIEIFQKVCNRLAVDGTQCEVYLLRVEGGKEFRSRAVIK